MDGAEGASTAARTRALLARALTCLALQGLTLLTARHMRRGKWGSVCACLPLDYQSQRAAVELLTVTNKRCGRHGRHVATRGETFATSCDQQSCLG